jgi:hypothetical protein
MKSKLIGASLILTSASLLGQSAAADGLLDRLKRRAEAATREAKELRSDVEAATDVDARVEGTIDRAVPSEADVEQRAAARVQDTPAVEAVHEAASDAEYVTTADERARAAVSGEQHAVEHEIDRATDIEGRARAEISQTEAAHAVRETQRDVDSVTTIDEQAQNELRQQRASLERALDD